METLTDMRTLEGFKNPTDIPLIQEIWRVQESSLV